MFNVGDIAVYPAHGVGVIESVETRNISGKEQSFLVMRILDNDMTIMIPTDNVDRVGLRNVITIDKVEEVFEILKERGAPLDGKTWNRRFREYSEKIKTGVPEDIAEVLRDLMAIKSGKGLSFGERKMLDNVKGLLTKEISIATNNPVDSVERRLAGVFEN